MDEEELEAVAHTRWEWDCPVCNEVNAEEHDPTGESVECADCGCTVRITESR